VKVREYGNPVARATPARLVETRRGLEVRCPAHGHLLGVLTKAGQLVIKCREALVIVRVPRS
jgi:hypothetical protein